MCENMLKYPDQVDFDAFCRDFLPKLFSFRNEKVPNIRLLLARFISIYLVNNERFEVICQVKPKSCNDSGHENVEMKSSQLQSELELTIQYLANDKESDVKCYFQSTSYNAEESCSNNYMQTKQPTSGDVSMEIASNDSDYSSPPPELPKIDSSSLSLASSGNSNEQVSTEITESSIS